MIRRLIGKKVYIRTNSGRNYTANIESVGINFLNITDKFNSKIIISIQDVEVIEEVRV